MLGPFSIERFTRLAAADKKKIIAFQDYWANHRWPMNFKLLNLWQTMLVPDELARKFLLEDEYKGEIIITGSPSADRLKHVDLGKDRAWLRKKFNVNENDFLILWVGRGTPQGAVYEEPTFKFFADSLRGLSDKNILLAIRPHPRDEDPARYKKFTEGIRLLDTSDFPSTDELLPIADAVVGLSSTDHTLATYLRIPGIIFVLPDSGKKMLEKISLADYPPNLVGATIGIYKKDARELGAVISKLQNDPAYRAGLQENQKKYFKLSEASATEAVRNAILA